jgi:hypothetical protein
VADGRVDEQAPQESEQHKRLEALSFGEGPDDQGRRDDRKHHLEKGERGRRNLWSVCTGLGTDALETDVVQVADHAPAVHVLAEGQRVAHQNPSYAHQRQDEHALHENAENVLATDKAAVKEGQGRRHQHDERSGSQHPGRVACVDSGGQALDSFASNSQRNRLLGFDSVKRREREGANQWRCGVGWVTRRLRAGCGSGRAKTRL